MDYFGTLGPACANRRTLVSMINEGMTGMRLNASHGTMDMCSDWILELHAAEVEAGRKMKLVIDLQGPELRIGTLKEPLALKEGDLVIFTVAEPEQGQIPIPQEVARELIPGRQLLLDDGKILVRIMGEENTGVVIQGGILTSRKSIAMKELDIQAATLTQQDFDTLKVCRDYGVTGIMQPFVREASDLIHVRQALKDVGCEDLFVYAKIENASGVEHLEQLLPYCDELVIARGDLGNSCPLWELPSLQNHIAVLCNQHQKPFMVVTQMLASMEQNPVPTRAEVSDIFLAVREGASSLMVTGETAIGRYPVETIRYLVKTAQHSEKG